MGFRENEMLGILESTRVNLLKSFQFDTRLANSDFVNDLQDRFYRLLDKRDRLKFVREVDDVIHGERVQINEIIGFLFDELSSLTNSMSFRESDSVKLSKNFYLIVFNSKKKCDKNSKNFFKKSTVL